MAAKLPIFANLYKSKPQKKMFYWVDLKDSEHEAEEGEGEACLFIVTWCATITKYYHFQDSLVYRLLLVYSNDNQYKVKAKIVKFK